MVDPRRRRRLVLGGLAAGGVLVLGLAWARGSGPDLPPRTLDDRAFARRADAVCSRALPALRQDRPEAREPRGDAATMASQVERAADGLADVAGQLRSLPVAAADEAEVDRWLDDWDAYVAVGRRYAEAVRRDDRDAYTAVAAEGRPLTRRVFLYARANGMPACVF